MRAFRFGQEAGKKATAEGAEGNNRVLASCDANGIAGFKAIKKQSVNSASSSRTVRADRITKSLNWRLVMKDAFILACRDYFVNNKENHRHPRKRTEVIPVDVIARRTKVRGKIVLRADRRHKPVRIPAMSCAELGHFLFSMELSRANA